MATELTSVPVNATNGPLDRRTDLPVLAICLLIIGASLVAKPLDEDQLTATAGGHQ